MTEDRDRIVIESRLQLFSALAEAAENEHNLMCLYLYAMFGMKRAESEGVSKKELEAIDRWRKVVLGISLEEMSHLSLVCNLFSAMGGTPHLARPNFPAAPGAYPAGMVIELAPFNLQTLEHFIFLEHPAAHVMQDASDFKPAAIYHRIAPQGRLTSSSGDYQTVGHLYAEIKAALIRLADEIGEEALFCGNTRQQITPVDSPLKGLSAVTDLKSALTAIETIIIQGEGAETNVSGSHFERFSFIKKEYLELLRENSDFKPGRATARNPVMRSPVDPQGRVWVNHPIASRYMDLANAFYGFMLKILVQIYFIEDRDPKEKHELLEFSFELMHLMAVIGERLTVLPVSVDNLQCMAGMSFAMERTLTPFSRQSEFAIIAERLEIYDTKVRELQEAVKQSEFEEHMTSSCVSDLGATLDGVKKLKVKVEKMRAAREQREGGNRIKPEVKKVEVPSVPQPAAAVETAETQDIQISFDAKKCIHSRHCVTELPNVFKANTPGEWLFPAKTSPDVLAAVIRECPSGALSYKSKCAIKDEEDPLVNVIRISENGPYRVLSDLHVDGKPLGKRATLCRCGLSKNKPFCDHSHFDAGFIATGEPDLISNTALTTRDGPLKVNRTKDGPLALEGPVEICASTGHIVLRTEKVKLCRCGHSKSKPICDGTHATIGFQDG